MKITGIDLFPILSKLPSPLRWGAFEVDEKSCIVIRVQTDDGPTGVGECGLSVRFFRQVEATIESLKPHLIGASALRIGEIWETVYSLTHQWGRRGVETYALSGIDIALWDIAGKQAGLSISKLLGETRQSIPAYYAPDLKDADCIAEECRAAVDQGFGAIKLRTGLGIAEDRRIISLCRKAVGDEITLMVDPNMAYDMRTAVDMGCYFHEHGIFWIEEPVRTHSLVDYVDTLKRYAERVDCYVAGGESLFTPYEFRELIAERAVDIVQPDCTTSGGITAAQKINALAEAWGIAFVPHVACSSIATIGLAAALQTIGASSAAMYAEYDPYVSPLRKEILDEPISPTPEGIIEIPQGPGLGIELNWDAVSRFAVTQQGV